MNKTNADNLLKVSGKQGSVSADEVKRLANAILTVYGKHGSARLQCVGAAAVNKATKAFIIANNAAKAQGWDEMVLIANYTTVTIDGVTKVGIIYEIVKR
ncbi:MAG: stage V sporulation protein S [Candidatus Competibacteraceae bacterium]|nr:stage V sporulation protein S [Candidatus Competibacteraceae bacterium]